MNKQAELGPDWRAMLKLPQNKWDLYHAALLIAVGLQPELDIEEYKHKLASLVEGIRSRIPQEMDERARIQVLNAYFYGELGFTGDRQDYYLPENSLINLVIERRRGIPITLAVIYLELARAIGLDAYGVGFPGHYLLAVHAGDNVIILDPFDGGNELSRDQLHDMLLKIAQMQASDIDLEKNLLPAKNADTVVRMLRNLKQIYIEAQKVEPALFCIEMILSVIPDAPDELRDRGMIYQHIEYTQGAINDLTRYLKLVPETEERGVIEALIDSLQNQHKSLH